MLRFANSVLHLLWWIIGQLWGQFSNSKWGSTHSWNPLEQFFSALLKLLCSPGGHGYRGQCFGKRWLSHFQYISSENRRTLVPVACVKQRGVKSETWSAYRTKGKLLWGISSESQRPKSPQQMGALTLWPQGDRAKEETRDHKKGWRHGWTVTHVPLRWGFLTHLAFGVSSCYQSCHEPPPCPPALHCSILHVDKRIKETR